MNRILDRLADGMESDWLGDALFGVLICILALFTLTLIFA